MTGTLLLALPNNIGKMSQLKYLSLSKTSIAKLPNSITELKQLSYLYLSTPLKNEKAKWENLLPNTGIW
ncbi:MAG: hypothetical protein GY810_24215 [Aureispira sp.]|nr:hypothetical protein [Aureispira sp.]